MHDQLSANLLRVAVVSPRATFRKTLATMLSADWRHMNVIDELDERGNQLEFGQHPDVVVIDASDSIYDRINSLHRLKSHYPESKYLLLGEEPEEASVLAAVRAGMDGFLPLGHLTQANLLRCVTGIAAGELGLPRKMAGQLLAFLRAGRSVNILAVSARDTRGDRGLTTREIDVLRLVAKGARNEDIARELTISKHTVNNHMQNIFAKLNVHSRVAAISLVGHASLWSTQSHGDHKS